MAYSQLATDDFNRADAANLGANWTVGTSTPLNSAAIGITSNEAGPAQASGYSGEVYNGSWPSDQGSIVVIPASGGKPYLSGPIVRYSAGAFYYLEFYDAANGNLYRYSGGSWGSVLATTAHAAQGLDVIELRVTGTGTSTVVTCYINSVLELTYADNGGSALNSGSPGIIMDSGGAGGGINAWEGWGDGTLGGGALVPQFIELMGQIQL